MDIVMPDPRSWGCWCWAPVKLNHPQLQEGSRYELHPPGHSTHRRAPQESHLGLRSSCRHAGTAWELACSHVRGPVLIWGGRPCIQARRARHDFPMVCEHRLACWGLAGGPEPGGEARMAGPSSPAKGFESSSGNILPSSHRCPDGGSWGRFLSTVL